MRNSGPVDSTDTTSALHAKWSSRMWLLHPSLSCTSADGKPSNVPVGGHHKLPSGGRVSAGVGHENCPLTVMRPFQVDLMFAVRAFGVRVPPRVRW